MSNKAHREKAKGPVTERPIIYPEVMDRICIGADALTVEDSKELLGWEESGSGQCLFKDLKGNKIWCTRNVKNRPIYEGVISALKQEHLRKRWRFNGEPIIVGRTGQILNGQHTLISHVLAEQERLNDDVGHWKDAWPGPVTMEKLVVFGIDEADEVVNTMDTCKPRSIADVIYRSVHFSKMKSADRRIASRMTDLAVRLLWHRTGFDKNAWAPRRTHSEALDFIDKHPKLLACVKHIKEEDGKGQKIGRWVSPGYAAGMLYLMGSCRSDGDFYRHAESPSEAEINWDEWERACEFWVLLASASEETKQVRYAIGLLADAGSGSGGSLREKTAVIAKAWTTFITGHPIEGSDVELHYVKDEDGILHFHEDPDFGGIDLGHQQKMNEDDDEGVIEPTSVKSSPPLKPNRVPVQKSGPAGLFKSPQILEHHIPAVPTSEDGFGKDGKPPAPKLITKRTTRRDVEVQQTAAAAAHDAEDAKAKAEISRRAKK